MNIMTSLHMDASPNASQSRSSLGESPEVMKSKDTTMIITKKPMPSKDKYATSKDNTYSNIEDQRDQ